MYKNLSHDTSFISCSLQDIDAAGTIAYDMHAVHCGVCVDITLDVMTLLKEGRSPGEIRDTIDERYRTVGPPTNTTRPPA